MREVPASESTTDPLVRMEEEERASEEGGMLCRIVRGV